MLEDRHKRKRVDSPGVKCRLCVNEKARERSKYRNKNDAEFVKRRRLLASILGKKYRERNRPKEAEKNRRQAALMQDCYIKAKISRSGRKDITQEMIELKRFQIAIKRQLREMSKCQKQG